jgi:hypothetical protein
MLVGEKKDDNVQKKGKNRRKNGNKVIAVKYMLKGPK